MVKEIDLQWRTKHALSVFILPSIHLVGSQNLGFNNLPEGLTKFTESCCTHDYCLLQLKDKH